MVKPRIEEVRRVAQTGNYNIMPVSMEMLSDIKTPVEAVSYTHLDVYKRQEVYSLRVPLAYCSPEF